jgi:hypothetical protein
MNNMYPSMNSCAFILECTKGRGRLSGGFPEPSKAAGTYRGELLGLLAIHLILFAINTIKTDISGLAKVLLVRLQTYRQTKYPPNANTPTSSRSS